MTSNDLAIEACGLAKAYSRNRLALAGLNLRVERGSIFGFLGPNGAGKTTAVKMLLGLVRPSAGDATVLGEPIGARGARRFAGYLPELFRYQDWLSGREVLGFHARLAALAPAERKAEIARVLALVSLTERAGDRVGTYSKGMQQRLGLAVALLGRPRVIFLDEPSSALDPIGRDDVRRILCVLRDEGTTIFLNSHLLTEVERICDRVAIVKGGRAIAEGSIAEIAGAQSGVRIRAESNGIPIGEVLSHFGQATFEAGVWIVPSIEDERIADAVAALTAAGSRVYAVEPIARTLEERFLEMMRDP